MPHTSPISPILEPPDTTRFVLACEDYAEADTVDADAVEWAAGSNDPSIVAALDRLRTGYRESDEFERRVEAHLSGDPQWG